MERFQKGDLVLIEGEDDGIIVTSVDKYNNVTYYSPKEQRFRVATPDRVRLSYRKEGVPQ